jgi:hypothetical protein
MELIVTRSMGDWNRSSRKSFVSIIGVERFLRQLDYKIEITPWHSLAPGIGPKQAKPANSQPSERRLIFLDQLEDFVSTCEHRWRIPSGSIKFLSPVLASDFIRRFSIRSSVF